MTVSVVEVRDVVMTLPAVECEKNQQLCITWLAGADCCAALLWEVSGGAAVEALRMLVFLTT